MMMTSLQALDLTVFICAVVWTDFVKNYGGGWVQFVSMSALILTVILYTLYVFQVQRKLSKIMPAKAPWDLCVSHITTLRLALDTIVFKACRVD